MEKFPFVYILMTQHIYGSRIRIFCEDLSFISTKHILIFWNFKAVLLYVMFGPFDS